DATDGRILVALVRDPKAEPRWRIGPTGMDAAPLLGADARVFTAGATVILDEKSALFPLAHLSRLPPGEYAVQAVLAPNPAPTYANAPSTLYRPPGAVRLDPAGGGTVKLELTRAAPAEQLPADTADVKFIRLRSELLSKFHGRPMYLRASLILPRDF